MKILMIGDAGYIHIRRWSAGLAKNGLDVSLFSRELRDIECVRVILSDAPKWRPWRIKRWVERQQDLIRKTVDSVCPDVIDVHFPGSYSFFPEDFPAIPLVVSTWGMDIIPMTPESPGDKELKVSLLQAADHVVCLSEYLRTATVRYANLDDSKVTLQYWGIDLERFKREDTPCEEPVIGFVKALTPKYGPDYLIEALPLVRDAVPNARLLMAGEGPMKDKLVARAHELGVTDSIEWCGKVEYSQVPKLFSQMSISAMPSTHDSETLGIAALESQAMLVPVVASDIGGIPESVVNNSTGILVRPKDSRSLADGIIKLLLDRSLRLQYAAQGRKHVKENFDWNKSLVNKVALYERVLNQKRVAK